MTFVPPPFAADAVLEAAASDGIELIVCITEGIPAQDEARVYAYLQQTSRTPLIGPNCPGVISPGKANVGIMPHEITLPGPVGVVSRSGTLTYQAVHELTTRGHRPDHLRRHRRRPGARHLLRRRAWSGSRPTTRPRRSC